MSATTPTMLEQSLALTLLHDNKDDLRQRIILRWLYPRQFDLEQSVPPENKGRMRWIAQQLGVSASTVSREKNTLESELSEVIEFLNTVDMSDDEETWREECPDCIDMPDDLSIHRF